MPPWPTARGCRRRPSAPRIDERGFGRGSGQGSRAPEGWSAGLRGGVLLAGQGLLRLLARLADVDLAGVRLRNAGRAAPVGDVRLEEADQPLDDLRMAILDVLLLAE